MPEKNRHILDRRALEEQRDSEGIPEHVEVPLDPCEFAELAESPIPARGRGFQTSVARPEVVVTLPNRLHELRDVRPDRNPNRSPRFLGVEEDLSAPHLLFRDRNRVGSPKP